MAVLEPKRRLLKGNLTAAVLSLFLLFAQTAGAVSDVEMTGFRITQETADGRWEIQAGKASYDVGGDVILQDVSARMITNGSERVRVVSDSGRYESDVLVLHLKGHVVVASAMGSRFEAPSLKWDGPGAVMVAGEGIQLQRGGLKVLGRSVQYKLNTGTAIIDGGVRTTWVERSGQR